MPLKYTYRCSEIFSGEKDVDDATVSEEADDPQEEEEDAEEISDELESIDQPFLFKDCTKKLYCFIIKTK